ncbi:hypothetical protein G9A89_016324 [Geosiphon pyriformis]|nr:hypothetical protein G9A89_016324 [Geosiphon pyriformis]
MDLKTVSSSDMSKKKVPKDVFYGPTGEKKVVLGNVKHSGDEKDISLSKSGPDNSVYSNVDSLFDDNEDIGMTDVNRRFLLGLVATTPKVKCINTGTMFGSLLGSPDFTIDDDEITSVEVSIKKSFALDINLSAVEGKSVMAKTQLIRKIFLTINGFGETTIPLKFEEIIRSTFTSESSMEKAALLAKEKGIIVNTNLKKQKICSNWAVVIKEISIDILKEMIVAALAEFGEIKSIKIQLIGLWQKVVVEFAELMVMTVRDYGTWVSRNQFRALLFTLSMRMTAHNLGTFLEGVGKKTCIINCLLNSGNRIHCAVIGFEFEDAMESAYHTEPIFSALECNVLSLSIAKPSKILAKLYAKKNIPISRSAVFVVSLAFPSGNLYFNSGSRSDPFPSGFSGIKRSMLVVQNEFSINDCLALLECSLKLLADQIKWYRAGAPGAYYLSCIFSHFCPYFGITRYLLEDKMVDLDPSSSKVLISKVGSLKSKIMALEVSIGLILGKLDLLCINSGSLENIVCWHKDLGNMILIVTETKLRSDIRPWIMNKFDRLRVFTFGLDVGFCGVGVAIIMNNSLAQHVSKMDEVPGHLISVCLLFKNKLSIMILGLYTTVDINSMVSKVVNSSSFVVIGGDFNENGSSKSASFKFCLGLGLVNTFNGHLLAKASTWSNSKGVEKVIDFILVSENLASAMALYFVNSVFEFFDTDHKSVFISIGLDGLLNTHLISIHKQANHDRFKDCSSAKFLVRSDMFKETKVNGNLNTMWKMLKEVIVQTADTIWLAIDIVKASKIDSIVLNSVSLMELIKHLSVIKKGYCKSKYYESKIAENTAIRKAIDYYMENFCSDKGKMIKSILKCLFYKVVLNHLVVNDELVIEPNKVKLKINKIMK